MKYFSNNRQFINTECEKCERVLKVPRNHCTVIVDGLAISPPVLCKCGTIHAMIYNLPDDYDHEYWAKENTLSPEQILAKSLVNYFAGSLQMRDWEDSNIDYVLKRRKETAQQIVKIGEPAVDLLIELLDDSDWAVRHNAALMLGQIKSPRALESLLKIMQTDESLSVSLSAAAALEHLGTQEIINTVHAWYEQKNILLTHRENTKFIERQLFDL